MADFKQALPYILHNEVIGWPQDAQGCLVTDIAAGMTFVKSCSLASKRSGDHFWYSDDPDDPGGATAWGLTLHAASGHGIISKEELRNISPEKVEEIYLLDYWRFNGLVNQKVATKLLDMCVNFYAKTVYQMIQESLNELGAALGADGIYGNVTEHTINAVSPSSMLSLLCDISEEHYQGIVEKRPLSAKYLDGWLRRAKEVPGE